MFRYKLRTLLILVGVLPPALAGAWFVWWHVGIVRLLAFVVLPTATCVLGLWLAYSAVTAMAWLVEKTIRPPGGDP